MAPRTSVQYVRYYTDGTAARKLETAVPTQRLTTVLPPPTHLQKKVKRKKIYVDPIAILGVVVAVCLLIVMGVGINQLQQARDEAAVMEQYVEQLTRENKELTEQYAQSYDLTKVKQTALALGMVPREAVPTTRIAVTIPETVEEPTVWETISTFLTGLFA